MRSPSWGVYCEGAKAFDLAAECYWKCLEYPAPSATLAYLMPNNLGYSLNQLGQ